MTTRRDFLKTLGLVCAAPVVALKAMCRPKPKPVVEERIFVFAPNQMIRWTDPDPGWAKLNAMLDEAMKPGGIYDGDLDSFTITGTPEFLSEIRAIKRAHE